MRRSPNSTTGLSSSVPAGALADAIASAGGELLRSVELFDVFEGSSVGAGRRSLAFTLEFRADDRTLTDADAETGERTVDVHIRRLRIALNGPNQADLIRTVRAAGYALDAQG